MVKNGKVKPPTYDSLLNALPEAVRTSNSIADLHDFVGSAPYQPYHNEETTLGRCVQRIREATNLEDVYKFQLPIPQLNGISDRCIDYCVAAGWPADLPVPRAADWRNPSIVETDIHLCVSVGGRELWVRWPYKVLARQADHTHLRLHRDDGPAVINADGSAEYWIDGVRVASPDEDI